MECVCFFAFPVRLFLRARSANKSLRKEKKFRLYERDLGLGEAIILKYTRARKKSHYGNAIKNTPTYIPARVHDSLALLLIINHRS